MNIFKLVVIITLGTVSQWAPSHYPTQHRHVLSWPNLLVLVWWHKGHVTGSSLVHMMGPSSTGPSTGWIIWGHDDVIKWKHFQRYWPFVRGIHRSPVNSPHKGQWCGALMFSLIYTWVNSWVNNHEAGDLRPHGAHYDIIVMANR